MLFFELPYYIQHPDEIIAIWHGGLAVHGGLLAGVASIYLGCRHYKISFLAVYRHYGAFYDFGPSHWALGEFL